MALPVVRHNIGPDDVELESDLGSSERGADSLHETSSEAGEDDGVEVEHRNVIEMS